MEVAKNLLWKSCSITKHLNKGEYAGEYTLPCNASLLCRKVILAAALWRWCSVCIQPLPWAASHTQGLSLCSGMRVTPCSMSGVLACSQGMGCLCSALLSAPQCHSSWAAALVFPSGCWASGAEIWSSSKAGRFCTEQAGGWASCALHLWIQQGKKNCIQVWTWMK